MTKIPNWSRVLSRTVQEFREAGVLQGRIAEWQHDETGDTITVVVDFEDGFYGIQYNGEMVTSHSTVKAATNDVRDTMRKNPEGL